MGGVYTSLWMCTPMLKMQRLIDAKCLVKLTNEKKIVYLRMNAGSKKGIQPHFYTLNY